MEIKEKTKTMDSIMIKLVIIIIMTLLLIIPITMIESMIQSREKNKTEEQTELNMKWGGTQKLSGAILVLPYYKNKANDIGYAYFMPDEYFVDGDLLSEERIRGIQKVLSYRSDLHIKGKFNYPNYRKLGLSDDQILWGNAMMIVGVSNLQGISNKLILYLDGKKLGTSTAIPEDIKTALKNNGVSVDISSVLEKGKAINFSFDLVLNGADGLHLVPIGRNTDIKLESNWKSLSFIGENVPQESINEQGNLTAQWTMFDYNRSFTPEWLGSSLSFESGIAGIDLLMPVNHYQQTMRAVKYALLFIVLTFVVFFMIEILGYNRIHPIQYVLVSLAMILFYTLLLSFSEHVSFGISYLVASAATILLITLYSKSIFKDLKRTIFMGAFLTTLYLFLYIVLQQEDMALLLGSVGLFIALAIVMYTSRKVDWYRKGQEHFTKE